MKKFLTILIVFILSVSLCACGNKVKDQATTQRDSDSANTSETTSDANVVDITEKMFVTYINDVYTNRKDYLGKTIKLEGMYTTDVSDGKTYCYVYRNGPGCCGNDGSMCGLEFTYNGDMPKDNDWIEVVGTLCTYDENGTAFLSIEAKSVTVKDKRGAETVIR